MFRQSNFGHFIQIIPNYYYLDFHTKNDTIVSDAINSKQRCYYMVNKQNYLVKVNSIFSRLIFMFIYWNDNTNEEIINNIF